MWKNLKDYFIVDANKKKGPANREKVATDHDPAVVPNAAPPPGSSAPAAAPLDLNGAVSDKFVKVLMQAMEAVNLPGFDYLEYKKSLQNLKKMNFSEEVRYQTAFTAAQSMGVTRRDLLQSADHYLGTLDKEQAKFELALNSQKTRKVADKQQRLKQLDQSVAEQEAKIKDLRQKISETRQEQQKLNDSIQGSMRKLSKTEADFATTFGVIAESIRTDVANVKKYLK